MFANGKQITKLIKIIEETKSINYNMTCVPYEKILKVC